MRPRLLGIFLLLMVTACADNYTHDETLAAQKAVEFAEVAFVRHDFDQSYSLLADKARAYVPLDKYKETVLAMHPNGYPLKVVAMGASPVKGEKRVNVAIRGDA